jgi:hypothetical protein
MWLPVGFVRIDFSEESYDSAFMVEKSVREEEIQQLSSRLSHQCEKH